MTTIINFFGAPSSGKSTISSGLFYEMKLQNYSVEMIVEHAKEEIYKGGDLSISLDPLKLVSEQYHRQYRLKNKVDYIITDSPLILAIAYQPDDYFQHFQELVFELHASFDNINFFLPLNEEDHSKEGRIHSLEESLFKENQIQMLLEGIDYKMLLNGPEKMPDKILREIESENY